MDEKTISAAFGQVNRGTVSRIAIELVEEVITQEQYTADLEAYRLIDSGKLTGEQAMMLFAGKRTLYKVLAKLKAVDRVGQSAAKRIQGAA
jgi:hypothetical protein